MPVLSIRQIYDAARSAGFDPHEAVTWTAIALAESGGRTGALNTKGEHSVGLWQINLAADSSRRRYGDLNDPANNARAAFDISRSGRDMRPWTTTHDRNKGTHADYRTYLDDVEKEIGIQGDPRGVHGYGAPLPGKMHYDDSYDRIDSGRALAGGSGTVPGGGLPGTSGPDADSDADGLTDAFEKLAGTDPGKPDTDRDGLTDTYEATVSHTDPLAADTDADGKSDPDELAAGTDAGRIPGTAGVVGSGAMAENVRNGVKDADADGLSDHAEQVQRTDAKSADTDHDGLTDGQEVAVGTNALAVDSDNDGATDRWEVEHGTNPLDRPVPVPAAPVAPAPEAEKPEPAKDSDSTRLDVFIKAARAQVGDRYVYGAPRGAANNANDNPKTFDCSSLTQWAAHQAGVELPNTAEEQYRFLKRKHQLISVEEAMHTKGALMFRFSNEPTGALPAGQAHVVISDGKGGTIEAMGTKYGVGQWSAKGRHFNFAAVIPGISDQADEPKPEQKKDAFAIDDGKPVDPDVDPAAATRLPGAKGHDADKDADGLTDAFEKLAGTDRGKPDTDGDGLTDTYEATVSHTDPLAADTDADGKSDPDELAAGTDPGKLPGIAGVVGSGPLAENVRNGVKDRDHDGLSNHAEKVLHTDGKSADTDHDGLTDGQEVALGTNPLAVDSDNDGFTDRWEVEHGSNPLGAALGGSLGSDVTGGAGSPLAGPTLGEPAVAGAGSHGSGVADVVGHG